MLLSLTDFILVCPASGIGCVTNNFTKSGFSMKSQPLCYDMGNAGDLLKHGILAEYTQWWCRINSKPICFLDPFGGRPWTETPKTQVISRVKALADFAFLLAQPEPEARYYGSGHIVKHIARAIGQDAQVLVSDRDSDALEDLCDSGLVKLFYPGFDTKYGFSILDTNIEANLLLLDPFEDFIISKDIEHKFQQIKKFSERMAVIVFILNKEPQNRIGKQYADLKQRYLSQAWTLCCPKLRDQGVRGESEYIVEVLLLIPASLRLLSQVRELRNTLKRYAQRLTDVLGASIQFSEGM